MRRLFERERRFLDLPLDLAPRLMLVAATVLVCSIYVLPLWNLTMFAPQYPDGLRLNIYSYTLQGGNKGQDIKEINVLNHYIGMRDLAEEDFTEFKWLPFVTGAIGLLFLRAAVHGRMAALLDVVVIYFYFAGFALWSFAYKLYSYGHTLAPTAAVKVPPFMPPLFGYKQLANFEVYSYPGPASYALGGCLLLLLAGLVIAWREGRAEVGASVATPSKA